MAAPLSAAELLKPNRGGHRGPHLQVSEVRYIQLDPNFSTNKDEKKRELFIRGANLDKHLLAERNAGLCFLPDEH